MDGFALLLHLWFQELIKMIKLCDIVRINDNGLVGQVCDVYDGWCYVDVDPDKLNGIKPELSDRLFNRRVEDVTLIKSFG